MAELAPRPFRATAPAALNVIGLFLNILGVLVIFVWGPPQPSLQLGVGLGLEDNTPIDAKGTTVADHDREVRRTRARYDFMSRAGLVLVLAGFALQLTASLAEVRAAKRRRSRQPAQPLVAADAPKAARR